MIRRTISFRTKPRGRSPQHPTTRDARRGKPRRVPTPALQRVPCRDDRAPRRSGVAGAGANSRNAPSTRSRARPRRVRRVETRARRRVPARRARLEALAARAVRGLPKHVRFPNAWKPTSAATTRRLAYAVGLDTRARRERARRRSRGNSTPHTARRCSIRPKRATPRSSGASRTHG